MKRYITIATICLAILAICVWRGCLKSSVRVETPDFPRDRASGRIRDPKRDDPSSPEEYEALVKDKSIEFAKRNNAPIAFYGKVVDQDGKPLQGVAVDITVTAIPAIPVAWGPDKTTNASCVTDPNGLFSVDGKHGTGLDVTGLSKQGYRESGFYNQGHVRYEPYSPQSHHPDRNKPVEFMLVRDELPQAQEVFDQRLRFNWNAEASIEDLGPDIGRLEITASRTGRDAANTMKKFEWQVHMRAMGFTLLKLPGNGLRVAPHEGYRPDSRAGFSPSEKLWSPEVRESYAIRTNGGAYGLMDLTLSADRDDGGVGGRVTIYLNKSGSRNLDHK